MNWRKFATIIAITLSYIAWGLAWLILSSYILANLQIEVGRARLYQYVGLVLWSAILFSFVMWLQTKRHQQSEIGYQNLVENALQGIVVLQKNHIVYANQMTAHLLGYSQAELYAMPTRTALKIVHPQDRSAAIDIVQKMIKGHSGRAIQELRFVARDGRTIWFESIFIKSTHKNKPAILSTYSDITQRKQAEASIKSRDNILQAVGFAAEKFLEAGDWTECIEEVLGHLGQVMNISRAIMFTKHVTSRLHVLAVQTYEWVGDGVSSQTENLDLQTLDFSLTGVRDWLELFNQGRPVSRMAHELPDDERRWILAKDTRSILCIPIPVRGEWWGFIRFDECARERAWLPSEIEALEAAAGILGAAIQRKKAELAIERQIRELVVLHKVSDAQIQAENIDELLERVTNTIGETLYPDNFGFMLLEENGSVLRQHASYYGISTDEAPETYPAGKGITGEAATTGKPVRVGDVRKHGAYYEVNTNTKSELAVPIKIGEQVLGVINAESRDLDAFSEDDERLLTTIAAGLANSIEKIRLFETEQIRRREAETLRRAAAAISSSLNLDKILDTILENLEHVIPYDSATVFLVKGQTLTLVAKRGFAGRGAAINSDFSMENPLINEMQTQGIPLILEDAQTDSRFEKWGDTDYTHGWMGIPLFIRGEMIGHITLDSRKIAAYTSEMSGVAQAFAYQAAAAIQNARLYQEALQAADRRAVLHRLSQDVLLATQDPNETYKAIHKAATELMVCDAFLIALRDDEHDENELVYIAEGEERHPARRLPAGVGLTGKVIQNGEALLIDDIRKSRKKLVRLGSNKKVHSVLAIPLRIRNKVIGMLAAEGYERKAYTDEERILLEMLASHAATALESGRLFQETQRRLRELESLVQASQTLGQTLELQPLLQSILDSACEAIPAAEKGTISLWENDQVLRIYAASGYSDQDVCGTVFEMGSGYGTLAVEQRRALLIPDIQTDPRFKYNGTVTEITGLKSAIIAPLIAKEQVIGVLSLDNSTTIDAFTDGDVRLLVTLAAPAALAIENAQLFSEIRRRLNELVAINLISSTLRMAQSLDEMLPALLNEIMDILELEVGAIWLMDLASGKLTQTEARGWMKQVYLTQMEPTEGIVGYVYRTGEPYFAHELVTDALMHPENQSRTPAGWGGACIPIRSTDEVIGAFVFAIRQPRRLKEDEIRLLATFADMAGSAIHRMGLYQRVEQQVKRLTALRDVDTAITSSFDLRVTLTILIDNAVSHLNVDAAAVLLFNTNSQSLTYAAGRGFRTPGITRSMLRIGDDLAGKAALDRTMVIEPDLKDSERFRRRDLLAGEDFASYCGVPLLAKGQVKGVLEIFNRLPLTPAPDWLEFLQTLAGQAAIAIDSNQLFDKLQRSNQELVMAYDTTLEGWSKALELRDRETEGHSYRVSDMTLHLARRMGIPPADMIHIRRGVLLHDIGKMGIPDHILRKTGPLTDNEWESMRLHPQLAYDLLAPIAYLRPALDIPYCHHETWDGKGYPRKLKEGEIPIAARIFTVVDVWDALLSDRPYRKAWERKKVIEYIKAQAGKRFDPLIVDVFLELVAEEENN